MLCLSGFELYSRWVPLKITNDDYKTTTELHGQVRQFQKKKKKKEVITKNFKERQQTQLSLKTLSNRLFSVCKAKMKFQ